MSASPTPAVVCSGLDFAWPNGTAVLTGLDIAFGTGRTGLVGRNGDGKSTLFRLISGELVPSAGSITTSGDVAYLPQRISLDTQRTVADLLAITERRAALRAVELGDVNPVHFTTIGDDWDVEARAIEIVHRLGVLHEAGADVLDRHVGMLSGGEAVLVGVAGLLRRRASITLLDEPTNNLDARARDLVRNAVDDWPGVLIVVSHDRELLGHVDEIVELREGAARTFGGPYSTYIEILAAEQAAAARQVRVTEGELAREKRQHVETQVKLARRRRFADTAEREKRVPKIIAHGRRQQAEVSAAKYRNERADRLASAHAGLGEAAELVRDDDLIRIDLPATAVPAGRDVLRVGTLTVRGPERIALTGANGSGKTTLLESILGLRTHPYDGVQRPSVPARYLPQRLDLLDDERTVLDNVRYAAPGATPHAIRAQLARFLIRGDAADHLASTLSGGERFRVTLACLLLAEPPPQLLLLDEPTNNLDLDSVEQLVSALRGFRGALIIASHDQQLLNDLDVTRHWRVADVALPTELSALR